MQALSDVFWDRIIRIGIWPARSLDLNPCDFFLRRLFEGQRLQHYPQPEEELKEKIRKEIANIAAEQLQRVNQNLLRRCKECLRV
jgi:hypothetical protein